MSSTPMYADGGIPSSNMRQHNPKDIPPTAVLGAMRAVVLKTHYPDTGETKRGVGVECDVVIYGTTQNVLYRVPVAQTGGAFAAGIWTPQDTRTNLRTGASIEFTTQATLANVLEAADDINDLDGDHVIVDFLGGDVGDPIIRQGIPHPRSKLRPNADPTDIGSSGVHPVTVDGPMRYMQHRGARCMVDRRGNVVIDTTEAPKGSDGKALSGSEPGGRIYLQVKGGERFELYVNGTLLAKVSNDLVTLGDQGTAEKVARKDDATIINSSTDSALFAWFAAVKTGITSAGGTDPGSPPASIAGKITGGSATVKAGD